MTRRSKKKRKITVSINAHKTIATPEVKSWGPRCESGVRARGVYRTFGDLKFYTDYAEVACREICGAQANGRIVEATGKKR